MTCSDEEGLNGSPIMEVELRESSSDSVKLILSNSTPGIGEEDTKVIVRAEEILLVVLVLLLWIGAIILFFNRWGKIRMLEPYQPKFQQNHRLSCPLVPLSSPVISTQQRMSFSKYNVSCFNDNIFSNLTSPNPTRRPRQNSVFVSSPTLAFLNPPRRTKSAMDIQHMVLNEKNQSTYKIPSYNSFFPIASTSSNNKEQRRPSINIERVNVTNGGRFKPLTERPPLVSRYYYNKNRRMSCFTEKIPRQRTFLSFDHPQSFERKTSVTIEKPSISFESPHESLENPSVIVESHCVSSNRSLTSIKETASSPAREIGPFTFEKFSKSLETHSPDDKTKPKRMAISLEERPTKMNSEEMKSFADQSENSDDCIAKIELDDIKLSTPLLENLESSDV